MGSPRLFRSKTDRRIAGVCGGLAAHFNQDPLLIRIGFFVFALCATGGIWAYILLWLLVPEESSPEAGA